MPRTRHEIDRESKSADIVGAARRQLAEGGLAGLSVKRLAAELGVAQNAVYWYFPTRDDLFVAALRQMLGEFAAKKPRGPRTPEETAVWMVHRLADVHPLVVDMYDRARVSPVVRAFADEVEAVLRGMVERLVEPHVPADERAVAVDFFWSTVEGALLRRLPRGRREAVVRFALARLGSGTARQPG